MKRKGIKTRDFYKIKENETAWTQTVEVQIIYNRITISEARVAFGAFFCCKNQI